MSAARNNPAAAPVLQKAIWYRIAPPLALAARFAPLDPAIRLPGLKEAEFVADGADGLAIIVFVARGDTKGGANEPLKTGEITVVKLTGPGSADHRLDEDTAFAANPANAGQKRYLLRSRTGRMLLAFAERVGAHMTLRVEGHLATGGGKPTPLAPAEFQIEPCYPLLKLWVAPGERSGYSDAAAYICLPDKNWRSLPGVALHLWTESTGAGSLAVEGAVTKTTDANGICRWDLTYRGLTWANLEGQRFTVSCGPADRGGGAAVHEWTYFDIAPHENVLALLQKIASDADRLHLNNLGFTEGGIYHWPSFLPAIFRGPAYNFFKKLQGAEEVFESMVMPHFEVEETYVCQQMRDRIYEEMAKRRSGAGGPDSIAVMQQMNGIEISQFVIVGMHVWAGIHLSGSKPDDDPRFIDPWWRQEWPASATTPQALMTWNWELANLAALVAATMPVATQLVLWLLPYFGEAIGWTAANIIRHLSARIAAWMIRSLATRSVSLGSMAAITGSMEAIACGPLQFLAGSANESCVDGKYAGFDNNWVRDIAIPHLMQGHDHVVTPARQGNAP